MSHFPTKAVRQKFDPKRQIATMRDVTVILVGLTPEDVERFHAAQVPYMGKRKDELAYISTTFDHLLAALTAMGWTDVEIHEDQMHQKVVRRKAMSETKDVPVLSRARCPMTALSTLKALEEALRAEVAARFKNAGDNHIHPDTLYGLGMEDAADELSAVRETVEQEMVRLRDERDHEVHEKETVREAGAAYQKWATGEIASLRAQLAARDEKIEQFDKERADGLYGIERVGRLVATYSGIENRAEAAEAEVERLKTAFAAACEIAESEHFDGCDECSSRQCDDSKRLTMQLAALAPSSAEGR